MEKQNSALILQAINEFATEGIQVTDAEGNYIFCNQAFTAITGIPASARLGHNVAEEQPDSASARVLKTGRAVFGHINESPDGVILISNAAPICGADGKLEGVISVFNDRSGYIKLTQSLREQENELLRLKRSLQQISQASYRFDDLYGEHPAFRACIGQAKKAAASSSAVLITGESGTGKELFAHAIHAASSRADAPFIRVNCPAIPSALLESELFGHEKGAFTGAQREKPGKFELAEGGSILLDEIGDMEIGLQAKLLRVLQEHEIERIGGVKTIPLNVRVIAATNQNLVRQIQEGKFRQDLYYRLNVIHIEIPPLRQRRSDIPLLLRLMLQKHGSKAIPLSISKEAMQVFVDYDWPGNVRELENTAERLLLYHTDREITKEDARFALKDGELLAASGRPEGLTLAELERTAIEHALERHGDSGQGKKAAAKELGISLSGLYKKLREYGISGRSFLTKTENILL